MEQEQKWIRAIQRRNSQDAAEQLIQSYYDEIYRFVCRQTGSKEDDMDLTQSIFIAVLRDHLIVIRTLCQSPGRRPRLEPADRKPVFPQMSNSA